MKAALEVLFTIVVGALSGGVVMWLLVSLGRSLP